MDDIFSKTPKTGVIFVMSEASKLGFSYDNDNWVNLGQGAPEVGILDSDVARLKTIHFDEGDYEYAPVGGIRELREAIAELYNQKYRAGKESKYNYKNVSICGGGRLALTRIAATLGNINLGHFIPDYTAYEELLNIFNRFVSIPISNLAANGFKPSVDLIYDSIINLGLGGILLSNPCNPTGMLLDQQQLNDLIQKTSQIGCAIILDEFYSHYIYNKSGTKQSLSAASSIDDINSDPVIIIDGLTKNWRYPGLRLSWTLGPEKVIDRINSAGSFLDGGATHIIQKSIIPLLKFQKTAKEENSIRRVFLEKRNYMVDRLKKIGFDMLGAPDGAFYCFPSLLKLPIPLQDGMYLFQQLLNEKVISVPGHFFDVNPGHRRKTNNSRLNNFIRFSYGPSMEKLVLGLDRINDLVKSFK